MQDNEKYFEANKTLWDQRTMVHKDSSFYDVAGFKAGINVLTPIELNEVGNVRNKKMLHLQCHFGLDSLNWARLGAEVIGVDFSEEAIREARRLNEEVGLNAKFICSNIYDLSNNKELFEFFNSPGGKAGEGADIIFSSYGVIGWLPDLERWASLIASYLKPGGFFYLAEFHPVIWMFDDDFREIKYSYENRGVIETELQGTYTDRNAPVKGKEYGWNHSLSEVVNALTKTGLRIEFLNEFMYSPYPCFNNVVQNPEGNWWIKGLEDKIPMVYSLKATKT